MQKRTLCMIPAAMLFTVQSMAQLHVGGGPGVYIKNGSTVRAGDLVLQPSSDLTLQNTTLSASNTAIQAPGGTSIQQVFRFSSPVVFRGTAGFYYTDAQLNGHAASGLALAYLDSVPGNWITASGTVVDAPSHYLSKSFTVPVSLSALTATTAGTVLPITLLRFSARPAGNQVQLDWEMSTTGRPGPVTVQRSADGRQFQDLKTQPVTPGNQSYTLYDEQPFAGLNCYRLRWTDEGGTEKFSAVANLFFGKQDAATPVFFPQPAGDQLSVMLPEMPATGSRILLISPDGKVLLQQPCTSQTITLDLKSYPAGMYVVAYFNGVQLQQYKITKL